MATYYTKCGRTFEKSSTAVTTGYRMADDDIQCHGDGAGQAQCPFRMDVKEGWPPVHKCWECRAGSQPPNHTTEWTGSLTDKNSIQIHSLDVALMEEIMSYCEAHPALGAAYNTDHLKDCRRTVAVHCLSNKTGIAAKKELIAKFFPEKAGGETKCEESQTNSGSGSCAPGIATGSVTSNADKKIAMTARDTNDTEEGKKLISENQKCIKNKKDCQYYCSHNDGCMLMLMTGRALENSMKQFGNCNCSVYVEKEEEVFSSGNQEISDENNSFLPENISKTEEIVTFDYSTVDEETGTFLQEKARKIMEIRFKSAVTIGFELKEAQEKLASHNRGTFISWSESLGLKKSSVYNYINAYNWVVQNLDNIEDINSIQQSLLFAVSKPSAPAELQQAVLTGDIKTHKEYKELEQKLKETEFRYDAVQKSYKRLEEVNNDHYNRQVAAEKEVQKLKTESRNIYEAYQKDLKTLHQQIDQARQDSDKVRVLELQNEIADLRQQLKDKPIEVQAARVVEKVPYDVQIFMNNADETMLRMQSFAKVNQILEMTVGISRTDMENWAIAMNNRIAVDDGTESDKLELLAMAIQSLQDMMDDYESRRCE